MKQRIALVTVFFLLTVCSYGQKKEMLQNNLTSRNSVQSQSGSKYSQAVILAKLTGHQNDLNTKFNTLKPSILKSTRGYKEKLDSFVGQSADSFPQTKDSYIYDAKGNLTQLNTYRWDSDSNAMLFNTKAENSYDANGNLIQTLFARWYSSSWGDTDTSRLTYDSKGQIIKRFYTGWDGQYGAWITDISEYTYDTNGNTILRVNYSNKESPGIAGTDKIEYTFNSKNKPTIEIHSYWNADSSNWTINYKFEIAYDVNGNETQRLTYDWDADTWVISSKVDYTNDANGHMTLLLAYYWDSKTSTWITSSKVENTYDSKGNQTQFFSYNWDKTTSAWIPGIKNDYGFDANGNPTSAIYGNWDEMANKMVTFSKSVYTYDLTSSLSNILFPTNLIPEFSEQIINKPVSYLYYSWDDYSNDWSLNNIYNYFYSETKITSIAKSNDLGINISPNPVSDYFKVSGITGIATISIYNLEGKLLLNQTVKANERVNVSGLNRGIYFYNLTIKGEKQSGKLIKN